MLINPEKLFLKIVKNEKYYNKGDERQFIFDLRDLFKSCLNDYTPSINLENLNSLEYNRFGYLLFVATLFFDKQNKNKNLINLYKLMTPKKISGTFFYLDREPNKNYDDLACQWNLTTSCHPIDLMKQLEF